MGAAGSELATRVTSVLARVDWPGKPGAAAPVAPLTAEEQKRFDAGREVYRNVCQACHQPDGRGQEKLAASLIGSPLVLGPAEVPARILLNGKEGPVGLMPPVGQVFTDAQIAAVLTYIRREWGQTGSAVDEGTVKSVRGLTAGRARPWTNDELNALLPKGRGGQVPLTCRAAVRLLTHRLTIVGAFLFAAGIASADQWPEFRGPTGQGHSAEQGLPLEWSESRNVRWKVPVPGAGWSSPVIADGRIWLTTATEGEAGKGRRNGISLRALAFDVSTGRELVNVEVFRVDRPEAINGKNSRASPTPIVDGDRVYVHFGAEGTAALSTSGEVLWRTRLAYASQHGSGGSPVLYGDRLIVNCDGNGGDAFVAALDVRTGKIRWRTERRQPADQAYSTPLVIRVGDQDQVVSVGAYRTAAYDPATGKEIWRVSYGDGFSNVPRPVYGDGLVYIATGFQQPALLAVRTDGKGDVTNTHVAWSLKRAAPYTPSPVLVEGQLYVVSDGGIASCIDAATGSIRWQHRLPGGYSASPVYAGGHIYFLNEDGVATVIDASTTFRQLAVNQLDGATLASMAVASQSIFIRTGNHLYRLGSPH